MDEAELGGARRYVRIVARLATAAAGVVALASASTAWAQSSTDSSSGSPADFLGVILIVAFVLFCSFGIPVMAILKKTGHSRSWAALFLISLIVPFFNVILLWIFAFKSWPAERAASGSNLRR